MFATACLPAPGPASLNSTNAAAFGKIGGDGRKSRRMQHPFINLATIAANPHPSTSPPPGFTLNHRWWPSSQKEDGSASIFFPVEEILFKEVSEAAMSSAKCCPSLAQPAGDQRLRLASFKPKGSRKSWTENLQLVHILEQELVQMQTQWLCGINPANGCRRRGSQKTGIFYR